MLTQRRRERRGFEGWRGGCEKGFGVAGWGAYYCGVGGRVWVVFVVGCGAALGLMFPFGVLLGGVILVVTFPVFGYVMYLALVVTMKWITGKPVDFR